MTSQRNEGLNKILLGAAALLVLLSAFSYRSSVQRAERFERGQKFLPNLDPDEVARITIRSQDGETVLRRSQDGDSFRVESADGYRADNSEVNRLLRDLLGLGLEKEVGKASASLTEELGLLPVGEEGAADETIEIELGDASGKAMVHFVLGSEQEDGQGQYVRRLAVARQSGGEDGAEPAQTEGKIYLTDKRLYLQTGSDDYVEQEIVDVPRSDVRSIEGDGFVFRAENGTLRLADLAEGKKETSKAAGMKGVLSPLRFTAHHLANAAELPALDFSKRLRVELEDDSGYVVELARANGKNYLRVQAFHNAAQEQVYIATDASEDEVRDVSEVLVRADEVADFNDEHGSWIYEVTDTVADRIDVAASELTEDA